MPTEIYVHDKRRHGCDCINQFSSVLKTFGMRHKRELKPYSGFGRDLKVIGSSEQVHVVDALAITGDEGRRSVR